MTQSLSGTPPNLRNAEGMSVMAEGYCDSGGHQCG